jgi:hypothetical protein
MKTKYSTLTRMSLTAMAAICLCSSVFAGPDRSAMFIMVRGQMMQLVPLTQDVTLKNGCKVCTKGVVITPKGKTIAVNDGDVISANGEIMTPAALHAHGG